MPKLENRGMEPRSSGTRGNPQGLGDLRQLIAEVVVEDDDGSMLRRQGPERALQRVPGCYSASDIGCDAGHSAERTDPRRPPAFTPRLDVAGIHDQSIQPGIEALRFTQGWQVPPRAEQGLLDGVLGTIRVAQDPVGKGVAAVNAPGGDRGERIVVTALRPLDQLDVHHATLRGAG